MSNPSMLDQDRPVDPKSPTTNEPDAPVALARAINDSALERRVGVSEKSIQQMHRVVQVIIIGIAGGNVQLPL